jgi:hypothetical protein
MTIPITISIENKPITLGLLILFFIGTFGFTLFLILLDKRD